jgi:Rhodopirellula transposase DDE domain
MVNFIGRTTPRSGLRMKAELETNTDEPGLNVSEKAMEGINLPRSTFHGEWHDQLSPSI